MSNYEKQLESIEKIKQNLLELEDSVREINFDDYKLNSVFSYTIDKIQQVSTHLNDVTDRVKNNVDISEDEEENTNYVISEDLSIVGGWNVIINNTKISDEVFDDDLVNYRYEDRVNLIHSIQEMLGETRRLGDPRGDAYMMDEDIDYLKTLNDNYVFSSISTNEYIAYSDNENRFKEICQDILDANKNLSPQEQVEQSDAELTASLKAYNEANEPKPTTTLNPK